MKNHRVKKELLSKSDWIILCVPIDRTLEAFKKIENHISKDKVFSDFTSVKSILSEEINDCKFEFISCHPLFGPLNNIEGQNIITIPVNKKEKYDNINSIFKSLKLKVTEMKSFEEHDKYI